MALRKRSGGSGMVSSASATGAPALQRPTLALRRAAAPPGNRVAALMLLRHEEIARTTPMDKSPLQQNPGRNGHRKDFSRITTSLPIPNLIDVQRRSYERFLQMNLLPEERANQGLQSV